MGAIAASVRNIFSFFKGKCLQSWAVCFIFRCVNDSYAFSQYSTDVDLKNLKSIGKIVLNTASKRDLKLTELIMGRI